MVRRELTGNINHNLVIVLVNDALTKSLMCDVLSNVEYNHEVLIGFCNIIMEQASDSVNTWLEKVFEYSVLVFYVGPDLCFYFTSHYLSDIYIFLRF